MSVVSTKKLHTYSMKKKRLANIRRGKGGILTWAYEKCTHPYITKQALIGTTEVCRKQNPKGCRAQIDHQQSNLDDHSDDNRILCASQPGVGRSRLSTTQILQMDNGELENKRHIGIVPATSAKTWHPQRRLTL